MKLANSKISFNKVIIISFVLFLIITLLSIAAIILNYYGTFDVEPVVEIQPGNTYEKTLHVATDWDYKPFSYIQNDKYAGLDVELVTEVANRLEMNLDLTLLDWKEAQEGLIDGTYDVILNMESNAVLRDDKIIGTIPTDEKQYVVYGKESVRRVGELYGMRVAAYNKFDELGMDVITGFSYQEMFEMLMSDELDYVICPIQIGDSFIEKLHAQHTIVSSYQVSYMYGCMALRAGDTELCARLNEVIKELQIEGFIDKLDKKWITRRYGAVTVKEVLENNPSVGILLIVVIQIIILGSIIIAFTTSNSRKQAAYTAELKRNIDIINRQNEDLIVAQQKAQAASVAKSNFLFNISHDIRTPMNAIIGFTNLAQRNVGDAAKTKDYLEKISTSSNLLLGLINDILEMARIESGKTQLNLAPTNILDIMDQTESVVRIQAANKNQELVFKKQVSHQFVFCDKLKINQIMMNLISNAVKYTNEYGHIFVSLDEEECSSPDKGRYVFRVKDDGIGMSEEFQKRIFEAFEREKTATVSKTTGTGLGMSITKNLVDLMDGEISLVSKSGEGSEFTVVLDLVLADEDVPEEEKEIEPVNESSDETVYRILVVDDHDVNRIIATELLSDMGYETDEACDGKEAIEIIRNAKAGDFDLILMDIQMPVINGYEASKAIRKLDSPLATIPIIALTANAFEDDKRDAAEAGMDGHVAKPIDVETLEKTLNKFLQRKS